MSTKSCIAINVFDGQTFETFKTSDNETGAQGRSYEVNGVEFEKGEWDRQQDKAIGNDMVSLGLRRPAPISLSKIHEN